MLTFVIIIIIVIFLIDSCSIGGHSSRSSFDSTSLNKKASSTDNSIGTSKTEEKILEGSQDDVDQLNNVRTSIPPDENNFSFDKKSVDSFITNFKRSVNFKCYENKFYYYRKLVNTFHTLPLLEEKLKELSWLELEFVNGFSLDSDYSKISSSMEDLNNIFSQEVKTKELNYIKDILHQYGISTLNHMTHIDNLLSILDNGLLSHNNCSCNRKRDISNQGVNARRERLEPIYHRKVHDYVPFYLNVKNSMLYVVQKQYGDKIVILGYSPDILFEKDILFTDRNAATNAVIFTDTCYCLGDKSFIDMDRVFNIHKESWNKELKHIMQAEILIPEKVGQFLSAIYVQNEVRKNVIEDEYGDLLEDKGIKVIVNKEMFF
ncbi:TPA: DUF4433 domain-containing protein [Neisseria subflava]